MPTRVLKVEISRFGATKDEDSAARTRLKELCEQVQQVTNFLWAEWMTHHHHADSADKIRAWQAEWIRYKSGDTTERPKLDVKALPDDLLKPLYLRVVARWPDLHTRVVALVINRWKGLVGNLQASAGAFPGWQAILLHRQAIPSFTKPLPVPFDTPKTAATSNGNARLSVPLSRDDSHVIDLRLARVDVPGSSKRASVSFVGTIWDKGRGMWSRRNTLTKIATGEYQMLGSQLTFSRGKAFADICYSLPDAPKLDSTGICVLQPGRRRPMLLKVPGKKGVKWIGHDGRVVLDIRRQLLRQRLSRKNAYRQCPTSNSRGHGLHRAIDKVTKLTRRWRDFCKTFNGQMAAQVRAYCVSNGIGTIYYARPKKDSRFLTNAGVEGWRDATGWDWFGFEKKLADECQEFGIAVIFRGEKKPPSDPKTPSKNKPKGPKKPESSRKNRSKAAV